MLTTRNKRAIGFAKKLRSEQTTPEKILWRKLRAHRFHEYKFKRQCPIGPWIADFACMRKKIVVEIDGGDHWMRKEKDQVRDQTMKKEGFLILRFTNTHIHRHMEWVLEQILIALEADHPR